MSDSVPLAGRAGPFGAFERTLAWRYLRAPRQNGGAALVSIISFVGIALAVTALVVVMSIMNGFRSQLVDGLLGGRGHVFVVVSHLPEFEAEALAAEIETLDGVERVTPYIDGQAFATVGERGTGVLARGMDADRVRALEFVQNQMVIGSADTFGDGDVGNDAILLGLGLARTLGVVAKNADGEWVLIQDQVKLVSYAQSNTAFGRVQKTNTFNIEGVFITGFHEIDKLFALIPVDTAQIFFERRNSYEALELRIDAPRKSERMVERLRQQYPSLLVTDWKATNASIVRALAIESTMMRIVFLVLVTITSLNIITGVVMLVKNKTRDVAILRTIGASQGSVLRIFLLVGAVLGIAGTLVGLVLGLVMVWNIGPIEDFLNLAFGTTIFDQDVYGFDGLPAKVNWLEIGFATLWAISMAVLVTLFPAWRAARLDPVDALRFE